MLPSPGRRLAKGPRWAPTGIFVIGYVVIWSLFSLGATIAQWALDWHGSAVADDDEQQPDSRRTPVADRRNLPADTRQRRCLRHCRSPVDFISSHWKPGGMGAFRMGIEHGVFCLGCCWILMGLLFFGGVMSLGGSAVLRSSSLEKVMPFGAIGGRVIGGIVGVWGLMVLILDFFET